MKRLCFTLLFSLAAMLGATIGVVAVGGSGDLSPTFAAILAAALGKLIVTVTAIGEMSALLYSALSEPPRLGWPQFLAGTVYGLGSTIGAMKSQASGQLLLIFLLAVAAFAVIALVQFAIPHKAG